MARRGRRPCARVAVFEPEAAAKAARGRAVGAAARRTRYAQQPALLGGRLGVRADPGAGGVRRKPGTPVPDGREIARIAEQAIALYKGTFLSGETFCPEIVTYRERLRSKFLRTVAQAGRHREQSGEWETAVACYEKGLEVDPLSEGLCRSLIACHVRMGRPAEAHAAYQRFRKTLSGVLGVSPSPDLEAILRTVPAVPGPGGGKECAGQQRWVPGWRLRSSRCFACSLLRRIRPTD